MGERSNKQVRVPQTVKQMQFILLPSLFCCRRIKDCFFRFLLFLFLFLFIRGRFSFSNRCCGLRLCCSFGLYRSTSFVKISFSLFFIFLFLALLFLRSLWFPPFSLVQFLLLLALFFSPFSAFYLFFSFLFSPLSFLFSPLSTL